MVAARRGLGRPAGDPARPAGAARHAARGAARGAAADRRGRVLHLRAGRPRGGRGGGTERSAASSRSSPGRRQRRARARAAALLLPLVAACVARRRSRGAAYPCRARDSPTPADPLRLDVFTLVPHAFAWLTEQRPLAAVLGGELELRLFSYRDTTPLRSGQVDDEPYGGGAGMLLRVDVVAAALEAAYGGPPRAPRSSRSRPQGRPLTQEVVEELAKEEHVTLLSARFEGFDERIVEHLCTDAISIGPYVALQRRPAGDGRRSTRSRAGCRARSPTARVRSESLLGGARRQARVPALHAPARVPRLARSRRPAVG